MAFAPKPEEPKKGAPEYMNTYGDLVTLMLTFFVLLFSMSTLDVEKFKKLAESFSGTPVVISGGITSIMPDSGEGLLPANAAPQDEDTKTPDKDKENYSGDADDLEALARANQAGQEISDMASEFRTYFAQNEATEQLEITETDKYLKITFPGTMLFDPGQAFLDAEAASSIDLVAVKLSEHPDYSVTVQGHTDNVPMSSTSIYPSNRHLSSARADTVVEYLIWEHDFPAKHTFAEGLGEYWPVAPNDSATNRALNRRVEITMEKIEQVDGSDSTNQNFFGG